MNTQHTKKKDYVLTESGHAISQVVAVAEEGKFRIYVAWEWENQAQQGNYGFIKSRYLYPTFGEREIMETARLGIDVGGTAAVKKIFKNLF